MAGENFSITTPTGRSLSGRLEWPSGRVLGAAIFAHCFTCTKQSKAAVAVTRALARQGIASLRFDFSGLGLSEGDFGRAGFTSDVEDLKLVTRALCERFGDGVLLLGHSLGGAAALMAGAQLGKDKVAAIATLGAPSDVSHVLGNIRGNLEQIEREGEGAVEIGGRSFRLTRDFLDSTKEANLIDAVEKLRCPLMILHSPTDAIVGIDHASRIYSAARHPKSFISLDGADHLLTDSSDADFAAAMVARWARRYLPERAGENRPDQGVRVETGHGKFAVVVQTPSHEWVCDEPLSFGGEDAGPSPYDLLLGALGACTAMTVKMYADRKNWPLQSVRVDLTHERDHAKDCDHCEQTGKGAKIEAIHRAIRLIGEELSDDQRARMMEIADKCPVHRTLTGDLHIHSKMVG